MGAIFLGRVAGAHERDWNAIWADGSWTETADVADAYAFLRKEAAQARSMESEID